MNKITLTGTITNSTITTTRSSGTQDLIPLSTTIPNGSYTLTGQIRSKNSNGHTQIYVHPLTITPSTSPSTNHLEITGYLTKPPQYRTTPKGRHITNLLIAIPNNNYVPVIAWYFTPNYPVGTKLHITGRLQSRTYKENQTTIEISAETIDNT